MLEFNRVFMSGVCLCVFLTANMTVNDMDRRNGNVETLQSYPQNLNLAGSLSVLLAL